MPKIFKAGITQAKFLQSLARYLGLMGGIGSGKTAAGVVKAITKIKDGDGIIVGPDYPHFSKSTWPELAKWLPWSRVTNRHLNHPHTSEKILKIATSQGERKIYYGGMQDASSWAGPSVNWAFADEFRRVPTRQHFDVLAGRIRVGPNPQLWLTTTPKAVLKGRRHWLYEVFVEQKFDARLLQAFAGENQKLVEYFNAPTSENSANLDPFYLLSLQALYHGKYAEQELGGEFIEFEGLVYENFSEEEGGNVSEDAEYRKELPIEWSVDAGFTAGHPRVILMAQIVPPYINIFNTHISTYELPEVSIDSALKMGYNMPRVAYCDSSAAELIRRLWERGIETHKGSHDVDEGIAHLRAFIKDGNGQVHIRFHPRCTFAIDELQAYAFPDTVESNISEASVRAARPVKEADNVADALRYLVWPKQIATLEAMAGLASQALRIGSRPNAEPRQLPTGSQQPYQGSQQQQQGPYQQALIQAPVALQRVMRSLFGGPRGRRPSRRPRERADMPPGW